MMGAELHDPNNGRVTLAVLQSEVRGLSEQVEKLTEQVTKLTDQHDVRLRCVETGQAAMNSKINLIGTLDGFLAIIGSAIATAIGTGK